MIEKALESSVFDILESTRLHVSTLKPSEWYEKNMVMPRGSAFPGPFSFKLTPYWREPLDCVAKDHPAKEVTMMKGAQLGGTAAVLNPVVGYTIAQNPGNIMFLTGHSDLSEAAMLKIDQMIDDCSLRSRIRPSVLKAKNSRTGDTSKTKEFPGGILNSGSVTNHNLLRQYDVMIMIVDDYDAAPSSSKQAGATRPLVQKRTSAFAHKKKIYWCSSPQLLGTSNIHEVFLLGDQRYYNVPCPKCGDHIVLKWEIEIDEKEMAGIFWQLDKFGNLDKKSVGYICQSCSGFFTDAHKYEMNLAGMWVPTTLNPKEENHWSYQISSLYAPPGMDDWAHYVQQYIEANPLEGKRNEKKHQTFYNVVLGEPYQQVGEELKGNDVQKNIRKYEVGTIPEKLSLTDGNGKVLLLTLAADLNGTEHDARLDFEVVAWTESGSNYSIKHGSIGTFIPKEGPIKADRERWTYQANKPNSVWNELNKILDTFWTVDTGRRMKISLSGIDCGFHSQFVYTFIDRTNFPIVGLKGKDLDKATKFVSDLPPFRAARERTNLFLVEVNRIKDSLSEALKLKWDKKYDEKQPAGFMNYPIPGGGLYLFDNFFSHYEGEHRVIESKDGEPIAARWVKRASNSQNHFWDVRVYNMVIKDIFIDMLGKTLKEKNFTWADYARMATAKK